jgi:GGDEF domain-containing protein
MPHSSHTSADSTPELRALLAEQEQLLSENLGYMALLSRYTRFFGLFSTLSPEALAERLLESLRLETRAQGGVLWLAPVAGAGPLRLAAVQGIVKRADEQEALAPDSPPPGLEPLLEPGSGAFLLTAPAADAAADTFLYLRIREAGRLLAVARVNDRLGASAFDASDLSAAEQFAELAALALGNALRFRALERGSLRDPRTHAFKPAFFEGVVASEIEKGHRFGRRFSLLEVELSGLSVVRERLGEPAAVQLADAFATRLQETLRGTDICAVDGESRYRLLLAETDAIGAAALKRRLRVLLESVVPSDIRCASVPTLRLATATFPADGGRLEELTRCLARRLDEESRSLARILERETRSFAEGRLRLLQEASHVPPRLPEQAFRFALEEVRRRVHERGLVWICPGGELRQAAIDELSLLRGRAVRPEIVLLADDEPQALAGIPVTCLPSGSAGTRAPFLVYLGEAPAYACLRERDADAAPFFHSSDRLLVEHLAFQLQRELGGAFPV